MAIYLGQITLFALDFAPDGFLMCNGQLLPPNRYMQLFSLIGTTYGGDGRTTFGVPDLRGRVARGAAAGAGVGEVGGSEDVALDLNSMPNHGHAVFAHNMPGTNRVPTDAWFAADASAEIDFYGGSDPDTNIALSPQSLSVEGLGQPHPNMQPYLALNYCIATTGVVPPREFTRTQSGGQ